MSLPGRIVCVGGAAIDRTYHSLADLQPHTSNPACGRTGYGGVARNVAECLARLGIATSLVSAIGDDAAGHALRAHLGRAGVDTRALAIRTRHRTAEYVAVLGPDGELALGLADMAILDTISPGDIERAATALDNAAWVFADCNLSAAVLQALVARRAGAGFRLAVDAVSSPKAMRLQPILGSIDLLFLNVAEAAALLGTDPDRDPLALAALLQSRAGGAVVLTRGAGGLVTAAPGDATPIALAALPATVRDVTGAGDALIAGTLSRLVGSADPSADLSANLGAACAIGMLAACLTIESGDSVRADLSPDLLARHLPRLPPAPMEDT